LIIVSRNYNKTNKGKKMKKNYLLLLALILILIPGVIKSQTYDLQFIQVQNDGNNLYVKIQIMASAGFSLASSNITFNFNSSGLSNPTLQQAYNFGQVGSNDQYYEPINVTSPLTGVASINIVLDGTNSGHAETVGTSWMDIAEVGFTITNGAVGSNLVFRNASPSNNVVYSCSGSAGTFATSLLSAGTWYTFDNALPVELLSFTASNNQDEVNLKWQTATEVNNYGFNIERKLNSGVWDSVAFVAGQGISNSPKQYSYNDANLPSGESKFQYRLKQIDYSGGIEYSDIINVEVVPKQYELLQNYPNPFNPSTTIKFALPKQTQVTINLYNILGQNVRTIANGIFQAGYYEVNLNASNLPSGMYIYRIESNDFVKAMKMMLVK
jgi:Secretion system C-terminal sorting domain